MSALVIGGDVSGTVTLQAPSAAGSTVLTLPSTSGTLVTTAGGTATTATNIAGGAAGNLHYQSAPGTTAFVTNGTTGQALISAGTSAPAWGALGIAGGGTNTTATPTAGGITYGTGTAQAYTAAGTAGQALISNGTSAPTWGSAGSYVLLATVTASSSATVSFNSTYITSTYDKYVIECIDVLPVTNNVQFYLSPSTNNGSTFPYSFNWAANDSLSGVGQLTGSGGGGAGVVYISSNTSYLGTSQNVGNAGGYNGTITLYKPSSSGLYKTILWQSGFTTQAGNSALFSYGGSQTQSGSGTSTTAYNYVKLYFSSGNISSGTFRLYGITNS